MKLALLALALVAALAVSEARPSSLFKTRVKKALMKAAKRSDDLTVEDILKKLDEGFTDDELAELAEIGTKYLGEEVTVDDVKAFIEEFGDMVKAAVTMALESDKEGNLQKFEEFLENPNLGQIIEEEYAKVMAEAKRAFRAKKSLGALLDDLDGDDLASIAAAVTDELGYEVTAQDVEDFMNAYGDEVEAAVLKAAEDLDHDQFKELEDMLEHPDLLGDVLEELGVTKKRGLLPEMTQDDFDAVAEIVSSKTGDDVSGADVKAVMDAYGAELEAALADVIKDMSPEEVKQLEEALQQPEILADMMNELADALDDSEEDKK